MTPMFAAGRSVLCPMALRPTAAWMSVPSRRMATFAPLRTPAVPLSGPGRDDEPVRIYRYAVDAHGQLFLHDTPVKNMATCFKDLTFLDFFFARVKPNSQPVASSEEVRSVIQTISNQSANGRIDDQGDTGVPAWDALDWTDRLSYETDRFASTKTEAEHLAARIAQRAGYSYFSPCMGELNFIRPIETDGTAVVYRDLVPAPTKGKADQPELALLWAGRRLERFEPGQLTLNPETGRMYHPSPRPLARAGLPVCALSDSLVLRHLADQLELVEDFDESDPARIVAWLHRNDQSYPIRIFALPSTPATAEPLMAR